MDSFNVIRLTKGIFYCPMLKMVVVNMNDWCSKEEQKSNRRYVHNLIAEIMHTALAHCDPSMPVTNWHFLEGDE